MFIPLLGYIWYKYTTPQDFLVDLNSQTPPYNQSPPQLHCDSGINIPTQANQIRVDGQWCTVSPLYSQPYYIVSDHFGAQSIRFIQDWFAVLLVLWAILFVPRVYSKVRGAMNNE
jgi:hypothetical protein